ncbi:MAG: hypothetical protein ACRDGG_08325 [Anaerolineae bacterium]
MRIEDLIWLDLVVEKLDRVFFIHKPGNLALIISARDMDDKERKRYGRDKSS